MHWSAELGCTRFRAQCWDPGTLRSGDAAHARRFVVEHLTPLPHARHARKRRGLHAGGRVCLRIRILKRGGRLDSAVSFGDDGLSSCTSVTPQRPWQWSWRVLDVPCRILWAQMNVAMRSALRARRVYHGPGRPSAAWHRAPAGMLLTEGRHSQSRPPTASEPASPRGRSVSLIHESWGSDTRSELRHPSRVAVPDICVSCWRRAGLLLAVALEPMLLPRDETN